MGDDQPFQGAKSQASPFPFIPEQSGQIGAWQREQLQSSWLFATPDRNKSEHAFSSLTSTALSIDMGLMRPSPTEDPFCGTQSPPSSSGSLVGPIGGLGLVFGSWNLQSNKHDVHEHTSGTFGDCEQEGLGLQPRPSHLSI